MTTFMTHATRHATRLKVPVVFVKVGENMFQCFIGARALAALAVMQTMSPTFRT